jgi:peroxiredoxin
MARIAKPSLWAKIILCMCVAISAGCAPLLAPQPTPTRVVGPAPGQEAPDFTFTSYNGDQRIRLREYRGQPVLLHFFHKSTKEDIEDLPKVQEIYTRYWDQGLAVVGVNISNTSDDLDWMLTKAGVNFPVVLDDDFGLSTRYSAWDTPLTLAINMDGVVMMIIPGSSTVEAYDRAVQELFAYSAAHTPTQPPPTSTAPPSGPRIEGCVNIGAVVARTRPENAAPGVLQYENGACPAFDARSADGAWLRLAQPGPDGERLWIPVEYLTLKGSLEALPTAE